MINRMIRFMRIGIPAVALLAVIATVQVPAAQSVESNKKSVRVVAVSKPKPVVKPVAKKKVVPKKKVVKPKVHKPRTYTTPSRARSWAAGYVWSKYRWGRTQFGCLNTLWTRESHWNYRAHNSSGAHGIPQALPGSKMSVVGKDWRSNPLTQIKWGVKYIKNRYGNACNALYYWNRHGWY